MIDFRYHLVSIVSVFLALAVGIVLGAGPLQGRIAETLTSEITQLRADKQALRSDVAKLSQDSSSREAYEQATLGRVVSGLTAGRGVAVVELPGADADVARQLASTVTAAGGTVTSTTRVLDTWVSTDMATKSSREELTARLASSLRLSSGETGSNPATVADRVLAAALASSSAAVAGPEAARTALTELVAAKLIDVDPKAVTPAQLVIVLSRPLSGTTKEVQAQAQAYVGLVRAFDGESAGSVLVDAADDETAPNQTSVVQTLRKDSSVAQAVSTVDDVGTGMGLASVILALAQEEGGTSGHYGTAEGASAPYAPLPKS